MELHLCDLHTPLWTVLRAGMSSHVDLAWLYMNSKLLQALCHEDIRVWGRGGTPPPLLTFAIDGGKWSTSRPGCCSPREKSTQHPLKRGWEGPGISLDLLRVESRALLRLLLFRLHAAQRSWRSCRIFSATCECESVQSGWARFQFSVVSPSSE
jgi:hypothetical protein